MKNNASNNFLAKYILKKLTKDNVSYQAVLAEVPLSIHSLYKAFLNGLSIVRSREKSAYPVSLCLEASAKCNLKCPMCPRTDLLTRDTGNMDYGLYKTIIDSVNPVFITLSQFGESLLHPRIIDMVSYARKKGRVVRLTTNASLLSPELSQKFIASGLSHLLISFDSCTKALYEKLRLGAIFEKVVSNIKTLLKFKKELNSIYPIVGFNMTLNKDNIHEAADMIKFCLAEFGIAPTFTKMYTYGEPARGGKSLGFSEVRHIKEAYDYARLHNLDALSMNLETLYLDIISPISGARPCFFPYYSTSVTWDGKVYPCCIYFDGQVTFGDLSKESFRQVWNGSKYQEFRSRLRQDREGMSLCRSCPLVDIVINNIIAKYRSISYFTNMISKRFFYYIRRDNGLKRAD